MKNVYIIRHSAPFVDIKYYKKETFEDINNNMILSIDGEKNAFNISKSSLFKNVTSVYSSPSARSIATSKYFAEINNTSVKVHDLLKEREFGIKYVDEIPEDFNLKQFSDDFFKLENGESLNDVKIKLKTFINEVLNKDDNNDIVVVMHGINMMCFLKLYCDVIYDEKSFKVIYKNNVIFDRMLKNPEVFKIIYDNNEVVSIQNINF